MNPNQEFYYKIEAYLCDGLPLSEKKALEKAMSRDPLLKKQVEMQRLEWDGMEALVETDLRTKMQDWDAEMPFELPNLAVETPTMAPLKPKIVPMRSNYRWSIAASVALAMGALIWLWQSKPPLESPVTRVEPPQPLPATPEIKPVLPQPLPAPPTTAQTTPVAPKTLPAPQKTVVEPSKAVQTAPPIAKVTPEPVSQPPATQTPALQTEDYAAIAEANYKTNPFDLGERTRSSNPNEVLTPAEKAYQQRDFKQVVLLLKDTPIEKSQIEPLNLLAHAYFQQKQFANALPLFEKMVDWNRLTLREEAEWYLLLDYLAQCPQYQSQFDALAQRIKGNPKHEFHSKVVALLQATQKK